MESDIFTGLHYVLLHYGHIFIPIINTKRDELKRKGNTSKVLYLNIIIYSIKIRAEMSQVEAG
jgi:hypothetical protein